MQTNELDQKIIAVQKSTRTSFPFMLPIHDRLRIKYKWYYNWHVNPCCQSAHTVFLIIFIIGISIFLMYSLFGPPYKKVRAVITTYTWDGGGDGTSWDDVDNWDIGGSYP